MKFCDLEFARRVEGAEGQASIDFAEARRRADQASEAAWTQVAGAYAIFDGVDSPCTQTFGLGVFQPVGDAELAQLEKFFVQRGADVFHEVSPLADPSLLGLLSKRGYRPLELSNVLFQRLDEQGTASPMAGGVSDSALRSRVIEPGEEDLWARTAAQGWMDVAPDLHQLLVDLGRITAQRRNTHCFLATLDDEPIATGALCLYDGVALFAGASTVPQRRQRGAQQLLLADRLQFAASAGCDLAVIVAQPGSGSQRNAERKGFGVAYTRIKWRLPRDAMT